MRVDHVDGLFDPAGYLDRLQGRLDGDGYVVVENILGRDEDLPEGWPVAGTTGYEFADVAEGMFVDPAGIERLTTVHAGFVRGRSRGRQPALEFDELAARCKRLVLDLLFAGEGRTLASHLHSLAMDDRGGRDLTEDELRRALVEVMAWLPVYRTYTTGPPVSDTDRRVVERAVRRRSGGRPTSSAGRSSSPAGRRRSTWRPGPTGS